MMGRKKVKGAELQTRRFSAAMITPTVIVLAVMNDTIKSEDDITRYLGISTLAAVPDRKDFIGQQNKKAKKKAKSRGGKK